MSAPTGPAGPVSRVLTAPRAHHGARRARAGHRRRGRRGRPGLLLGVRLHVLLRGLRARRRGGDRGPGHRHGRGVRARRPHRRSGTRCWPTPPPTGAPPARTTGSARTPTRTTARWSRAGCVARHRRPRGRGRRAHRRGCRACATSGARPQSPRGAGWTGCATSTGTRTTRRSRSTARPGSRAPSTPAPDGRTRAGAADLRPACPRPTPQWPSARCSSTSALAGGLVHRRPTSRPCAARAAQLALVVHGASSRTTRTRF